MEKAVALYSDTYHYNEVADVQYSNTIYTYLKILLS